MKGLFFVYGEMFRKGKGGSRNIGSKESYNEQKQACESHVSLLNHLKKEYDCDCDVMIATYDTPYTSNVKSWYPEHTIVNCLPSNKFNTSDARGNHHKWMREASLREYDFVFKFRPDLFFKHEFIYKIFNPNFNKMYFYSICAAAKNWHLTYVKNPRVNDVMLFIPKHLHAYYLIIPHHFSIDELVHHKELYPQQVDFMVYTYHDSDTSKDLNSGYKIVNRPEAKKTLTPLSRTIDHDFPMFKRS